MLNQNYGANQMVVECKNYGTIGADDFHQAAYYMNDQIGRFCLLATRLGGELTKRQSHTYEESRKTRKDSYWS